MSLAMVILCGKTPLFLSVFRVGQLSSVLARHFTEQLAKRCLPLWVAQCGMTSLVAVDQLSFITTFSTGNQKVLCLPNSLKKGQKENKESLPMCDKWKQVSEEDQGNQNPRCHRPLYRMWCSVPFGKEWTATEQHKTKKPTEVNACELPSLFSGLTSSRSRSMKSFSNFHYVFNGSCVLWRHTKGTPHSRIWGMLFVFIFLLTWVATIKQSAFHRAVILRELPCLWNKRCNFKIALLCGFLC